MKHCLSEGPLETCHFVNKLKSYRFVFKGRVRYVFVLNIELHPIESAYPRVEDFNLANTFGYLYFGLFF